MVANNVIALGSVVVFSRLLNDYGSLAALVSYFLILAVVGYAMQLATAREAVLGHLGVGAGAGRHDPQLDEVAAGVHRGDDGLLGAVPASDRRGGRGQAATGAPALGIPAGCLYLMLCILRGFLQGLGDYRAVGISLVGEQAARLVIGGVLAAVGLGVTGAYIGTPLSFVAMMLYCARALCAAGSGVAEPGASPGGAPVGSRPQRVGARSRRSGSSPCSRTSTSSRPSTASRPTSRAPTAPPRWPRRS